MNFTIKDIIEANPAVDRKFISRMMYTLHHRLRMHDTQTKMVQIPSKRGTIMMSAYVYDIDEAIDFIKHKYNTYRGKKYPDRRRAYLEILENVKWRLER